MYTIKKSNQENFHRQDLQFVIEGFRTLSEKFQESYNWQNFRIMRFLESQHLWICYRHGDPCGFLMATLGKNFFDSETIMLKQNLLFALPNTKAAHLLFKEFIDFGKAHANHVLTTINSGTNIKPRTLERFGFHKLEELYRLEIK